MQNLVLCIIDGLGIGDPNSPSNAFALAKTPTFTKLFATCPHTSLIASCEGVGLPSGQFGNSEVGHTIIGAGRIPLQTLPKISATIDNGLFFKKPILEDLISKSNNNLHLVIMLSSGGVHSHEDHFFKIIEVLAPQFELQKRQIICHLISDGRDVPPGSIVKSLQLFLKNCCERHKNVSFATLVGRYYAMDRDNRKERTNLAVDAITNGKGQVVKGVFGLIESVKKQSDEFIKPIVNESFSGIFPNEDIMFLNFRPDRMRQLVATIESLKVCNKIYTMEDYFGNQTPGIEYIFGKEVIKNTIGEVVSTSDLTQLRIAETEKYAHVTYFFSGGREDLFKGESRVLVPSPKVNIYSTCPEMSCLNVCHAVVKGIENNTNLIIVNFANCDMVGHCGELEPAIKAVEAVDNCLEQICESAKKFGYAVLITSDHGNVEEMGSKSKHTQHTTNPVPFISFNVKNSSISMIDDIKKGTIAKIAPFALKIMDLPVPKDMID